MVDPMPRSIGKRIASWIIIITAAGALTSLLIILAANVIPA